MEIEIIPCIVKGELLTTKKGRHNQVAPSNF